MGAEIQICAECKFCKMKLFREPSCKKHSIKNVVTGEITIVDCSIVREFHMDTCKDYEAK